MSDSGEVARTSSSYCPIIGGCCYGPRAAIAVVVVAGNSSGYYATLRVAVAPKP